MGRNVSDGIVGLGLSWSPVGVGMRSEEFLGLVPLDALIPRKLQGKSGCPNNGGSNVEEHMTVHSLSCKVVLLVSLNVECRHFYLISYSYNKKDILLDLQLTTFSIFRCLTVGKEMT